MIAFILFQINILTLSLLIKCAGRKRYDGDRDVDLVQPGTNSRPIGAGGGPILGPGTLKPSASDDFSVGIPPPHVPLADKSDDRTLADIESIQSEKVLMRDRKQKLLAAKAVKSTQQLIPSQSPSAPGTPKSLKTPVVSPAPN